MVVVDISGVLGRRPLLGGAHSSRSWIDISGVLGRPPLLGGVHSSWSWLTSLVFSVDGHFSVEPIRHGRG